MKKLLFTKWFICLLIIFSVVPCLSGQNSKNNSQTDQKVRTFLDAHSGKWSDMNIPETDGKILYDLIIKGNYKRAVEIGTSTGHSGIWIAWALSKTGGKLITIEINEERYREAMENFRKAGLEKYIDARLADAHQLVKELEGPFDFVFSDADKDWYKKYFIDLDPKLITGGCFTAHNVYEGGRGFGGTKEFLDYIRSLKNYETSLDSRGNGLSISYKRSNK